MDHGSKADEAKELLQPLIGTQLFKSRNFCATRHFYFRFPASASSDVQRYYTLGLECPWRIQLGGRIIVGSEDYYEQAENNDDPSWEPGMAGGHLQDQKLAELLGELRDGDVFNTGTGLIVASAEADSCAGFQLGFTDGYCLDVFPCSRGQMEWLLERPSTGSVLLIRGGLTKSSRMKSGEFPAQE